MTQESRPRLARTSSGRVFGGVAAGLGRYLGVDPRPIRIGFAILSFFGLSGIWLYLILWAILPMDWADEPPERLLDRQPRDPAVRLLVGGILVVFGGLLVVNSLISSLDHLLWPAAFVAVGTAVIVYALRN